MKLNIWFIIIGLMFPFLGTALGAASVLFFGKNLSKRIEKGLSGFASGVMTAASLWSLLLPAKELAEERNVSAWVPCAVGSVCGAAFLWITDIAVEKIGPENLSDKNIYMLIFAVTLHNIPEGMAVGAAFAGSICDTDVVSLTAAMSLCIGISIQNIPEGAIISSPLFVSGKKKINAFLFGMLSGAVEPIGALLTLALTGLIVPILPYLLSFAAGAMIYAVFGELNPNTGHPSDGRINAVTASAGFAVMTLLDIALG